jgi:uncharacterized protein
MAAKHKSTTLRMMPWIFLLPMLISACQVGATEVSSKVADILTISATATVVEEQAVAVLAAPIISREIYTATPSPVPSETPLSSPTHDPYWEFTIDHLSSRAYGGGVINSESVMAELPSFTRHLIAYPSDDLTIYGFMNVPKGEGLFPVIIALHGYVDPKIYHTLDYTTRYADALALAGFFVLHPNLRGYPPSTDGENLFRVGMAIDVLNLIELVKTHGGQAGPLEKADPNRIGIWGHSMGGGITTRVITVSPDIRAAVIYAGMSGDERQNFEAIFGWSQGQRGIEELSIPVSELTRISPIFSLDRIQAAVSIHHGDQDSQVPLVWSVDICDRLGELQKAVECFTYAGQPHTFRGEEDTLFVQRTIEFFSRYLLGP